MDNSSDLIVPEYLLKKFPFIQTLVAYLNVADYKYDLTFLSIILDDIIRNEIVEEKDFLYETIVHQFATCLYILGVRTAYKFVRLNIPVLLPSVRDIQAYIGNSDNYLTEGLFNYGSIQNHLSMNRAMLEFVAEYATAVVPKVTCDTKSNIFIGFSLSLDSNDLPIPNSYSTDSFIHLEEWYSHITRSTLLNAYPIALLSSSLNILPYIFAAEGIDNKFGSSRVIFRWRKIYQECKTKGIRILGFSTDCDSRYFHSM